MNLDASLVALIESGAEEPLMDGLGYANWMDIRLRHTAADGIILRLPFRDTFYGAPGRFHGGALASVLELALHLAVADAARRDGRTLQTFGKMTDMTVDYVREAKGEDLFAAGHVLRMGGRIAQVRADAWQRDRKLPVASARGALYLRDAFQAD